MVTLYLQSMSITVPSSTVKHQKDCDISCCQHSIFSQYQQRCPVLLLKNRSTDISCCHHSIFSQYQQRCPVPLINIRNTVIYRTAYILSSVNINKGTSSIVKQQKNLNIVLLTFYLQSISTIVNSSTFNQQKHCDV